MQLESLASYDGGMGVLEASCVQGCSCGPGLAFDAHTPLTRTSRHVLGCFAVSAHAECHVRLALAARTSSGGHKFVLHALRVLEQPAAAAAAVDGGGAGSTGACDAALPQRTHAFWGTPEFRKAYNF